MIGTINDLRCLVDELLESNLFSSSSLSSPSTKFIATKTSIPSLASLADDIDSLFPRKSDKQNILASNKDFLKDVRTLFQTADEVLTTLFSIVMVPSSPTPTLSRQSRLARIIKDLQDYNNDFENVRSTDMGDQLGSIQNYIMGAVDSLQKASAGMNVLEQSVASVTQVLEKIKMSSTTWEMLAKKHQCLKVLKC